MLWTEFFRIKEQHTTVEVSALRLKRLLKAGAVDAAQTEVACMYFNYKILEKMKEQFKNLITDERLENQVYELIKETHSLMEKHGGKKENDKTNKNI